MTGLFKERLIADIGGTNARFALLSTSGEIHHFDSFHSDCYPSFVAAVNVYLESIGNPDIDHAAVAIANPVRGDWVQMTNHSWAFSIEETRLALGFTKLIFRNDFAAMAMSVPLLEPGDLRKIGGNDVKAAKKALAVLGPGTGLGVSGLIHTPCGWVPIEGEGGHVTLSPANHRECEILTVCWEKHEHISAERLISGAGLQVLYRIVCELDNVLPQELTPAEVSKLGISGDDQICTEALSIFCGMLGGVAGNLVLTLGAFDGVYICGGIVPQLGEYFETTSFRERFESKGRFRTHLQNVPVYVINRKNPALLGIGTVFDLGDS